MRHFTLTDLPVRELFPGYRGKFITSDTMTFVYWDIAPGYPLPPHSHPHEQVVNVLEGEFELVVDGERVVLGPGMVATVPGGKTHTGQALSQCRILDVFYPIREEYR